MRNGFRVALASAALAAGLAFADASSAEGQVRITGSFPLPHGRISIGFGDPVFPVGTCVPDGYEVYSRPDYGYGFEYESRWIPVRRYGSRWFVCDPPAVASGVYDDDDYSGNQGNYGDKYYGGEYYGGDVECYGSRDYGYGRPSYSYARPSYSWQHGGFRQRRRFDERFERRRDWNDDRDRDD